MKWFDPVADWILIILLVVLVPATIYFIVVPLWKILTCFPLPFPC